MGSPDFAIPSLLGLDDGFEVVGVITQPDRPSGRGRKLRMPAVKKAAIDLELPIIQPKSLKDFDSFSTLQEWQPDVIVVVAFGQILPPDVLSLPPHGCLNVHASLLPRWRGAAPIQAAILHGDEETGATIMKMDEGLDTGPILAQESTFIYQGETGGELFNRLAPMGAELLLKTLPPYAAGELSLVPQDESQATYAPMLRKADGELDFHRSASFLARQVRAYNPWPGSHFQWDKRRHIVHEAKAIDLEHDQNVGTAISWQGYPAVICDTNILVFHQLQPAGKQSMDGSDFLNGAKGFIGASLLSLE